MSVGVYNWYIYAFNLYSITSAPSSLEEEDQQKSSMEAQMPPPQIYLERTLAIVKPDAMNKVTEIEDIILRNGFSILQVGITRTLFNPKCF